MHTVLSDTAEKTANLFNLKNFGGKTFEVGEQVLASPSPFSAEQTHQAQEHGPDPKDPSQGRPCGGRGQLEGGHETRISHPRVALQGVQLHSGMQWLPGKAHLDWHRALLIAGRVWRKKKKMRCASRDVEVFIRCDASV